MFGLKMQFSIRCVTDTNHWMPYTSVALWNQQELAWSERLLVLLRHLLVPARESDSDRQVPSATTDSDSDPLERVHQKILDTHPRRTVVVDAIQNVLRSIISRGVSYKWGLVTSI